MNTLAAICICLFVLSGFEYWESDWESICMTNLNARSGTPLWVDQILWLPLLTASRHGQSYTHSLTFAANWLVFSLSKSADCSSLDAHLFLLPVLAHMVALITVHNITAVFVVQSPLGSLDGTHLPTQSRIISLSYSYSDFLYLLFKWPLDMAPPREGERAPLVYRVEKAAAAATLRHHCNDRCFCWQVVKGDSGPLLSALVCCCCCCCCCTHFVCCCPAFSLLPFTIS